MSSTSSITINWDPIPDGDKNGILLGYQVVYRMIRVSNTETSDEKENETSVGPTEQRVTLTQLSSFAKFSVKVGAFTRIGVGPFSETLYAGAYSLKLLK